MATGLQQVDKILVTGLPANLSSDKLIIYFQRRKIGGGDVASVTFPVSKKEPNTAIVTFDEAATVQSILSKTHSISGHELKVVAYANKPEIFEKITATLSESTVQSLSEKKNITEVLEYVSDSTGCEIEKTKESKFEVKGRWYQIKAALERLEQALGVDEDMTPQQQSLNGYLARDNAAPRNLQGNRASGDNKAPTASSRQNEPPKTEPPKPVSRLKKEVIVSTIIDKDIYAYMELVHGDKLGEIRSSHSVSFDRKVMNDAAKIQVIPDSPGSDPQKAVKALEELSSDLQKVVAQDTCEIDPKIPRDALERVFSMLRPEFPQVYMDQIDNSPENILFIAPDNEKCRMAIEMFQLFYGNEKDAIKIIAENNKKSEVAVDIDIYTFMKRTMAPTLETMWRTYDVEIVERLVEDCVYLTFKPKSRTANCQGAINEFQKKYGRVNDGAHQETIDITSFSPVPKEDKVNLAVARVNQVHPKIYAVRMLSDKNYVLFLSAKKVLADSAIADFKSLIKREE